MPVTNPYYSVVIPVYNEKESLPELKERVTACLEGMGRPFEILFVNDGSTDGTANVLNELQAQDPRTLVIHFRRNFGKAAALSAGFAHISGEIVFTLDADLQDVPEEMPKLLGLLEEGYDLASGWKYPRRDPWTKRLPSRIYNTVVQLVSGLHLHDMNCGFKAYRSEVLDHVNLYGELHRYIPLLAHSYGFRVGEVKVAHQPRIHGKSKYGLWRFFSGFFDLFTVMTLSRFGASPLHAFGLVGLAIALIGGGVTGYMLLTRILGNYLSNRPLFYFGLSTLTVGIQVVFFGLLAEMIARFRDPRSFYSIREIRGDRKQPRQEN